MKITAKELAERLDGREYQNEITPQDEQDAKESGLVIMFGYSDDNVEIRGALYDEISAYSGTTVHFEGGEMLYLCEDSCKYYEMAVAKAKAVDVALGVHGWEFETDIPHEAFEVMEDGEHYGEGIVFNLNDIE